MLNVDFSASLPERRQAVTLYEAWPRQQRLGGEDGRTLFIAAAQWHGMQAAMSDGPDWTGQLLAAAGQPSPHAGRP